MLTKANYRESVSQYTPMTFNLSAHVLHATNILCKFWILNLTKLPFKLGTVYVDNFGSVINAIAQ